MVVSKRESHNGKSLQVLGINKARIGLSLVGKEAQSCYETDSILQYSEPLSNYHFVDKEIENNNQYY